MTERFCLRSIFTICLFSIFLTSCQKNEKDVLIDDFNEMYATILNQDFKNLTQYLDEPSKEFVGKVTDENNLNIDSMIVLGKEYNLRYLLAEYMAFNGDEMKKTGNKEDFYRYLGSGHVSIFSFLNAYYVEREKTKVGKENFVSLLREDMTTTKRAWTKFKKSDAGKYRLDLLYTLGIHEQSDKRLFQQLIRDNPDKNEEEALKHLYWQNSGENTEDFVKKQKLIEDHQLESRKLLLESYRTKGYIK